MDKVRIENVNGLYIRTYTLKEHGKDFEKMAKQFVSAKKNKSKKYRIIK